MKVLKLYGIWCKDANDNKGDWLREPSSIMNDGGAAILAFGSKREAERRAAEHYGYKSYSKLRRDDWCEVRELTN